MQQKLFLDTSYFAALVSKKDNYYKKAVELSYKVEKTKEVWTHEGIILEIGDLLAKNDRDFALKWSELILSETTNIKVEKLSTSLIKKGLSVYKKYNDKTVGLTDCISFQVMWDKSINEALTADNHFVQVGFRALLLDDLN